VLDMGEPVHILDLAKRMIELSGYRRSGEIDVVFTGARPGEKLFEELQYSGESIDKPTRRGTRRSRSGRSRGCRRRSWRWLWRGCGSWLRPARPTRSGRAWARSCRRRSSTGARTAARRRPPDELRARSPSAGRASVWPGEGESAGPPAAGGFLGTESLPKSLGMTVRFGLRCHLCMLGSGRVRGQDGAQGDRLPESGPAAVAGLSLSPTAT